MVISPPRRGGRGADGDVKRARCGREARVKRLTGEASLRRSSDRNGGRGMAHRILVEEVLPSVDEMGAL